MYDTDAVESNLDHGFIADHQQRVVQEGDAI